MKHLLVSITLLLSNYAFAERYPYSVSRKITIHGTVSDLILKKIADKKMESYLLFSESYVYEIPSSKQVIPIKILNNKFSVSMECKGDFAHIMFWLPFPITTSAPHRMFLFATGDSVNVTFVENSDLKFSGRGASQLNYQLLVGKITNQSINASVRSTDYKDYKNGYLVPALDSLTRVSAKWDSRITNILRLNTITYFRNTYLTLITKPSSEKQFPNTTSFQNFVKVEIENLYKMRYEFIEEDPFTINNSLSYFTYLLNLNIYYSKLLTGSNASIAITAYHLIKQNYSGLTRDKLLTKLFLSKIKQTPELLNYLPEAVGLLKDKSSSQILNKLINTQQKGVKAFDFTFIGMDNQPIKLTDFNGRILIIDTFYQGCIPCINLTKQMKPIEDYFKDRKDIAFLSLNALDKDLTRVNLSVKSGKYGGERAIYAHTGGLGAQHPYILYYNIKRYPSQVIIGKDGTIIASGPTRPIDEQKRNDFIKLIEDNL